MLNGFPWTILVKNRIVAFGVSIGHRSSDESSLWDIPTNETNELFYAKIMEV
jgi:hypothetical protein